MYSWRNCVRARSVCQNVGLIKTVRTKLKCLQGGTISCEIALVADNRLWWQITDFGSNYMNKFKSFCVYLPV